MDFSVTVSEGSPVNKNETVYIDDKIVRLYIGSAI